MKIKSTLVLTLLLFMQFNINSHSQENSLKDIKNHWGYESISEFYKNGYIKGYEDHSFKPNNNMSRAEFVTAFNNYFNLQNKTGKVFDDTLNHWAKDAIDIAFSNGICQGTSKTTFEPDKPITREEMCVMIANYLNISDKNHDKLNKFIDKASSWAEDSVEAILENKIMRGYEDNSFKPQKYSTRAEVVSSLDRVNKKATNNSTVTNNTIANDKKETITNTVVTDGKKVIIDTPLVTNRETTTNTVVTDDKKVIIDTPLVSDKKETINNTVVTDSKKVITDIPLVSDKKETIINTVVTDNKKVIIDKSLVTNKETTTNTVVTDAKKVTTNKVSHDTIKPPKKDVIDYKSIGNIENSINNLKTSVNYGDIPKLNSEISNIKNQYKSLNAKEKELVKNYGKINIVENEIKNVQNDMFPVFNAIGNIPKSITKDNMIETKKAVEKAESLYNNLSKENKKHVSSSELSIIEGAKQKIGSLSK